MIQIYNPENTNYEQNGDCVLMPMSALITAELNGAWSAAIEHPIDDAGRWRFIVDEAVVKMPSFNGEQLFRIKQKEKSDLGITATLEPIFFDAMDDCFLIDIRPTEKNGQEALDIMTAPNSKYKGSSDIIKKATAYYQFKNLIEAINGEDENSFISRWGGEIMFDNFQVIINQRVGNDNGVELRYGKNIPVDGMSEEVDMREVVTRIYPKAFNGHAMTDKGYVDSDLIDNYPTVKATTITFDDVKMAEDARTGDEENGVIICSNQAELDAALRQKCNEQFAAGLDKPKVTISADMVLLQNAEEYKKYNVLEEVSLGDTIHCINNHLDIVTDARVIGLVYDSISKKTEKVIIGDYQYNYFSSITSSANRIDSIVRSDGTVIAEKVQGFIDAAQTQLRLQNTLAQKQDVRAILFEDLDPASPTFGAMALGTQGLQISRQRTAADDGWIWTTAMTAQGLIADIISGGTISGLTIISKSNRAQAHDIIIEEGEIKSEGEIFGFRTSLSIRTRRIELTTVIQDTGDKYTVAIISNGINISTNDGELAASLGSGNIFLSNKNGDHTEIGPGTLSIYRDGKTLVEY